MNKSVISNFLNKDYSLPSMTGYGKGVSEKNGRKVSIEIRTVNHRFLDIQLKLPREFQFADETIRKIITASFHRGHVDVFFNFERDEKSNVLMKINEPLVLQYNELIQKLYSLGCKGEFTVGEMLRLPDVVKISDNYVDEGELINIIADATNKAVKEVTIMRLTEGRKLIKALLEIASDILKKTAEIEVQSSLFENTYREKLEKKMKEILAPTEIDEKRIISEAAIVAERSSVSEEIVRIHAHAEHMLEILDDGGPVGKRLDFLAQEILRECNTIASKVDDAKSLKVIVDFKASVESFREQIQNVE
ncbi:MAG: YicC family protein [Christensenellaceae bacterium]|jgi:uncharacterized protein (TIGR00255 family)|nr:YicC family protein [Christensenellaceae bacterium]